MLNYIRKRILFLIIVIKVFHYDQSAVSSLYTDKDKKMLDFKCTNQSANNLKFHLPVTDLVLSSEYNVELKECAQTRKLFVLHGPELYQLLLENDEKHIIYLGRLQHLDFLQWEILYWENYYIIVVALQDQLAIYQIPGEIVQKKAFERTNTDMSWMPIQQISIQSQIQKLFLTSPTLGTIILMLKVKFTVINDKLFTFAWKYTYFDAMEELLLLPVQAMEVIGPKSNFIVTGRVVAPKQKSIITIYEMEIESTLRLKISQTITVDSETLFGGTFQGMGYMIACSKNENQECYSLQEHNGKFDIFKTRSYKELKFNHIETVDHFIVGVTDTHLQVFPNIEFHCHDDLNLKGNNVSQLIVHESIKGTYFIVLHYKHPFKTLLSFLELEVVETAQLKIQQDKRFNKIHSENILKNSIAELRGVLLRRRVTMEVFKRVKSFLNHKLSHIKAKTPIHLENGYIGLLEVLDKTLLTPAHLLKRIEHTKHMITRQKPRYPRSYVTSAVDNTNQTAIETLKVRRLLVKNLIYEYNVLDGYYLENNTGTLSILSISKNITSKFLDTEELFTRQNYKPLNSTESHMNSTNVLKVHQLEVESINNVSWVEFYDSVFLKNRDTQIKGRLIFQSDLKVNKLKTLLLNGQLVAQLFNLITPQVVKSSILISAFFANEMYASKLNGLDFAEDVVFSGENVIIDSPVIMYEMSISEDLIFPKTLQLNSSIGPEYLQQVYTGEVVINGSLHLNNVYLDSMKTEIWLDDVHLVPALLDKTYLLNNTEQVLDFSATFGNAKITSPALYTHNLNDYPTTQHLLASGNMLFNEHVNLIFLSAEISKNLTHANKNNTKLWHLHESVVHHGEVANITGFKIFISSLLIGNLLSLQLNNQSVEDLVLKRQLINGFEFLGTKYFEEISVASTTYISYQLNATYLNNGKLGEFLNYNYYYENLAIPHHLQVSSLVFQKLNGIPFDEIFTKIEVRNDELVLQTSLFIDGNVDFNDEITVTNINNLNWNDYQRSLVIPHETVILKDEVIFLKTLNVSKALTSPFINKFDVSSLFSVTLTKSSPQQISGVYTFKNLKMLNVEVGKINNIPTTDFINTQSESIVVNGDLVLPSTIVMGNSSFKFVDNLKLTNLQQDLHTILQHNWKNIVVHENVTLPDQLMLQTNDGDILSFLWKHAVRRGAKQTITGNLRVINPTINKMFSKSSLSQDLDGIISDSLLKNSSFIQYVIAPKFFETSPHMRHVSAELNLEVTNLNNININSFNETLYRLSSKEPITASLHFLHAPLINATNVDGFVNGRNTSTIYLLDQTLLPPIKVSKLSLEKELEVYSINHKTLNNFLQTRVTKDGSSIIAIENLVFENLIITEKASLRSINDMTLDVLVFQDSKVMQTIDGPKQVLGRLLFEGPVHAMQVNNRDLMESFLLTIHTNKDFHFDTLTVSEATFNAGLRTLELLESSEERLNSKPEIILSSCVFPEREQKYEELSSAVESYKNANNQRSQLRYIDFDLNMQVMWEQPKENISRIHKYQLTCNSLCERNFLIVQRASHGNRLYLKNATTSHIKANNSDLFVKVENNCDKFQSKIELDINDFNIIWDYSEIIESADIFAPKEDTAFLLLNVINFYENQAYIRIIKIDKLMNTILDWQNISISTMGEGMLFVKNRQLITLSLQAKGESSINVYGFDRKSELFDLRQIIEGEFDLVEIISSSDRNQQIIASCWECLEVKIYFYNQIEDSYNILQIIRLELPIEQLIVFKLNENNWYLLILSKQPDHFEYHLYKYANTKGWMGVTQGKFENLHAVLPLISKEHTLDEENSVLLVCDKIGTCHIVKAFIT